MSKVQKISGVLAILWMACIFYLSHQAGEESSQLSSIVAALFSAIPAAEETLHYIVRKGAHVFAYFLLTLFLYGAFRRWYKASAVAVLYAATDEFHQTFIPGRSGQISDVAIDSIGVVTAVLLVFLVLNRSGRHT
ncbi:MULTISPECIES: VanZ family protein [Salimicrobium]|uniref:VanZ like family protein n=2 Tax=Salimicrobium TaxID=351195 RepID=A0ABY1KVD7_9BACI|nr:MULTISPECIES: VanZ family protein [Salimicrobium]SDX95068.1 VanZ like family protein [Salimicrobium album]SIS69072.1 VanZ like family protein [Salimicrobium salexigens]